MGKPHATDARRAGWHADTGASTDTVMGASTNTRADLGADGRSGTDACTCARASTIAGGHADARSRTNARLGTDSNTGTCADASGNACADARANTGPRPGTHRITRGTGPCDDWNRYRNDDGNGACHHAATGQRRFHRAGGSRSASGVDQFRPTSGANAQCRSGAEHAV